MTEETSRAIQQLSKLIRNASRRKYLDAEERGALSELKDQLRAWRAVAKAEDCVAHPNPRKVIG